uniref:COesterase domain-containing protein n=1 Tax=Strongyloides venezuelensis TaxID=75913 RepID=A0A0K0FLP4_STRVS
MIAHAVSLLSYGGYGLSDWLVGNGKAAYTNFYIDATPPIKAGLAASSGAILSNNIGLLGGDQRNERRPVSEIPVLSYFNRRGCPSSPFIQFTGAATIHCSILSSE